MKDYKMEEVLTAVKGSASIMSTIAQKLNCNWMTAQTYVNKWEETKIAYSDEIEKVLDICESSLFSSVKGGDVQSAKWILSTKGKKRGYSEKMEIDIKNPDPINITVNGVKVE
jgi:phosphoenolpyruvate carboxylase